MSEKLAEVIFVGLIYCMAAFVFGLASYGILSIGYGLPRPTAVTYGLVIGAIGPVALGLVLWHVVAGPEDADTGDGVGWEHD